MNRKGFLLIFLMMGGVMAAQKVETSVTIVVPGINTTNTIKLDDLLIVSEFPASKEGYRITGFTVSYMDKGAAVESTSESNKFTEDMLLILGRIREVKTDPVKLTFTNIKAIGPKKKEVMLAPKTIRVKK